MPYLNQEGKRDSALPAQPPPDPLSILRIEFELCPANWFSLTVFCPDRLPLLFSFESGERHPWGHCQGHARTSILVHMLFDGHCARVKVEVILPSIVCVVVPDFCQGCGTAPSPHRCFGFTAVGPLLPNQTEIPPHSRGRSPVKGSRNKMPCLCFSSLLLVRLTEKPSLPLLSSGVLKRALLFFRQDNSARCGALRDRTEVLRAVHYGCGRSLHQSASKTSRLSWEPISS